MFPKVHIVIERKTDICGILKVFNDKNNAIRFISNYIEKRDGKWINGDVWNSSAWDFSVFIEDREIE